MKTAFNRRLARLCGATGFSIADLAAWLERPHSTVSGWMQGTRVCRKTGMGAEVYRRLDLLDKVIKLGQDFPVPAHIVAKRRGEYARLVFKRHDEFSRYQ